MTVYQGFKTIQIPGGSTIRYAKSELNTYKLSLESIFINLFKVALAGVSQWIECWPANQGASGLIPSQSGRMPGLRAVSPVGGA